MTRTSLVLTATLCLAAACISPPADTTATSQRAVAAASSAQEPDLCGTLQTVDLSASQPASPTDQHVFCRPIPVAVPATISAVGDPGKSWAVLSLSDLDSANGPKKTLTCRYRSAGGGNASYAFSSCNRGARPGDIVTAQVFVLSADVPQGKSKTVTAQVSLSDGTTPPPDAVRELLGTGTNLKGVKLRAPASSLPPFTRMVDGPPIPLHGFVAEDPPGAIAVGASVQVTGAGPFGPGVQLLVPFDAAFIASLPAGSRDTLRVEKIDRFFGPVDAEVPAIRASPVTRDVVIDGAAALIQVGLDAAASYITVVKDLTPLTRGPGPIMSNGVNVYLLWVGDFSLRPDVDPHAAVEQFINDVGASSWYAIQRTYGVDTLSVTFSGKVEYNDVALPLTNKTVWNDVVWRALKNRDLPADPDGVYLVLGATNVDERNNDFTPRFCGGGMCGFHTDVTPNALGIDFPIKYAFIGHPAHCVPDWGHICDATAHTGGSQTPNPIEVDGMISTIAHELVETVTDPLPDPTTSGWMGQGSIENADKCAWYLPSQTVDGTPGTVWNVAAGDHKYFIQSNWVNQEGGYCATAVESVLLNVSPPDGGVLMNDVGTFIVHVTNTGPNVLDGGAFLIRGRADGPIEGTPLTFSVPRIAPGATVDVNVPVQAPNDIDGNEAQVPFRFVMFEPRNNNHTFPNEGVAVVTVKRAAVLKNDATCASITVQGSIPIPWWTWVPVRVRLTNPGPSAWVPGAYQAVRLPYGSDFPFVAELPQLTKTIKPSETWDFMVYVASQEGGTIEALEIGMANAATQFGASCATTFEVGCQDGSTAVPLYTDQDQDGYGTGDLANHCRGPGFSDISGDCCDADRSVHPGAISPAYAPVASCGVEWDTACTGATGPEVCDGRDNDKNGIADDKIGCHRVILKMSGIDDNAVVWSGTSADGPGYCEVAYDNGPATGSCELTFDAINTGSEELTYVVKLGNGGGFITSGKFELLIDDNTVLLGEQLPVYAHSGWTYRNQFTVNFKYGYLVSSIENPCVNALDCNY